MRPNDRGWAESFQWIFDGHNQIFADPELQRLQLGGRRQEARAQLEVWLGKFARAIGRNVWVVYDGRPVPISPGSDLEASSPFLHVFFSEPPEEADDRICRLVRESRELGRPPIVVSSDRRTLEPRIAGESQFLSVSEFARVHERTLRHPEKWVSAGMEDIEQHFLRGSPFADDRRAADGENDELTMDGDGADRIDESERD